MQKYTHRQAGTLTLWSLGLGAAVTAGLLASPEVRGTPGVWVCAGVLLILLVCLWIFSSLSVEVSEREVLCAFGGGFIRKRFPLRSIASARAVRNRWYYGWGIRWIPGGWMFNVSGLDAVELELRTGGKFRIGTDDPKGLAAALERARASAR